MTSGRSAKPDRMSESLLRWWSFAVSMRWTMSWSVPCVASVVKVDPISAAQIVYSLSRMLRTFSPKVLLGLHATGEELPIVGLIQRGGNALPAAWNAWSSDQMANPSEPNIMQA